VNKPEILLLDEPLGALDMKLRRQMQTELKRIQTDVGLTFVHVTHDQEEAMSMADTVAVMNAGRIEQLGAPQTLYDLPRTAFVANFLGRSNLMPGRVVGRHGEHLEVDAAGHRLLLDPARAAADSGDVLVGIRPEKLDILEARPGDHAAPTGENTLAGTVTDTAFAGMSNEYRVEVPGLGNFSVFAQNRGAATLRPGDAVTLSWSPEHAFGLDGREDAEAGEGA
jgi:spermidine/putrescine transport system ATP-binding protein